MTAKGMQSIFKVQPVILIPPVNSNSVNERKMTAHKVEKTDRGFVGIFEEVCRRQR